MRFVALEKDGVLALGSDPEDFAVIAGRHIQIACIVEDQVPDVLRAGIEKDRGGEFAGRFRFIRLSFSLARRGIARRNVGNTFNAIHLAIGIGGSIENAVFVHGQRLHLQFLRLKNGGGLALRRNAIDTCGRAGSGVKIPALIRGDRPDIGGRRGGKRLDGGGEFETPDAANGHACSRSLAQVVEFGLFPGASTFAESEMNHSEYEDAYEEGSFTQTDCQFLTSYPVFWRGIQIITERRSGLPLAVRHREWP